MQSSRHKCFIGIDQTGAVLPGGAAKPLPVTCIRQESSRLTAYINRSVRGLYPDAFADLVPCDHMEQSFILVDSVLGIPASGTTRTKLRTLFRQAAQYSLDGKGYGAAVAHKFFHEYVLAPSWKQKHVYPMRQAEASAGANSIFRLQPFQRNIGCGTFRTWKDLDVDQNWYRLWPFETPQHRKAIIAEGYPSLLWKYWVQAKRGDQKALVSFAQLKRVRIDDDGQQGFQSVDHMDSFVLALYAACIPNALDIKNLPAAARSKEGWIVGLDLVSNKRIG
jgi:hypothetical protein